MPANISTGKAGPARRTPPAPSPSQQRMTAGRAGRRSPCRGRTPPGRTRTPTEHALRRNLQARQLLGVRRRHAGGRGVRVGDEPRFGAPNHPRRSSGRSPGPSVTSGSYGTNHSNTALTRGTVAHSRQNTGQPSSPRMAKPRVVSRMTATCPSSRTSAAGSCGRPCWWRDRPPLGGSPGSRAVRRKRADHRREDDAGQRIGQQERQGAHHGPTRRLAAGPSPTSHYRPDPRHRDRPTPRSGETGPDLHISIPPGVCFRHANRHHRRSRGWNERGDAHAPP